MAVPSAASPTAKPTIASAVASPASPPPSVLKLPRAVPAAECCTTTAPTSTPAPTAMPLTEQSRRSRVKRAATTFGLSSSHRSPKKAKKNHPSSLSSSSSRRVAGKARKGQNVYLGSSACGDALSIHGPASLVETTKDYDVDDFSSDSGTDNDLLNLDSTDLGLDLFLEDSFDIQVDFAKATPIRAVSAVAIGLPVNSQVPLAIPLLKVRG